MKTGSISSSWACFQKGSVPPALQLLHCFPPALPAYTLITPWGRRVLPPVPQSKFSDTWSGRLSILRTEQERTYPTCQTPQLSVEVFSLRMSSRLRNNGAKCLLSPLVLHHWTLEVTADVKLQHKYE